MATQTIAPALLSLGLAACSGSGVGLDANGMPLTGSGGGSSSSGGAVPLSADFESLQQNVFTPICSVCHIGADAPEGLILDAQHSYSLLVDVPSTEVPSLRRVDPGNPSASYLIQKLEGTAAVGGQMPLGQPPLPASTLTFITQWITDGAQPGTAPATDAFALASVSPEDGSALPQAPAQIVVSFTRELDATRINTQSIRLEFDPAPGIVTTTARVPAGDPSAVLLAPLAPLAPGRYRVVLSAQPGIQLTSVDGRALTPGPLNDEGDRTVATFKVRARATP